MSLRAELRESSLWAHYGVVGTSPGNRTGEETSLEAELWRAPATVQGIPQSGIPCGSGTLARSRVVTGQPVGCSLNFILRATFRSNPFRSQTIEAVWPTLSHRGHCDAPEGASNAAGVPRSEERCHMARIWRNEETQGMIYECLVSLLLSSDFGSMRRPVSTNRKEP